MAEAKQRNQRRVLVGIVTRDKNDKTRRVEIQRLEKHPRYGKYIRKKTVCYAHDEKNETRNGDKVEIMETRPLSKTKCWRIVRVLVKAPELVTTKAESRQELPETVVSETKEEATEQE